MDYSNALVSFEAAVSCPRAMFIATLIIDEQGTKSLIKYAIINQKYEIPNWYETKKRDKFDIKF